MMDQPYVLTDYHEAETFQPDRFSPIVLTGTERLRVVLTCFEPGQFIPVHTPRVDVVLVVIEGQGQVMAGDQEAPIGPGSIILVPAGEARGVKADTRLVAAHIVAPPPSEQDHLQVMAGLQRGTWR